MKNRRNLSIAVAGATVAIMITTTMDATGLTIFSALPLMGLLVVFCLLQRLSFAELGLQIGKPRDYLAAVAHPLVVMTPIAALAYVGGAIDLSQADGNRFVINLLAGCTMGVLMGLLTEEGFFRGWLWATLCRSRMDSRMVLVWTTIAFTLWHLSAVFLTDEFSVPAAQVPVFLANVVLLGAIWGMLRWKSGSIVVASVGHALWNSLAYGLFGFGTRTGELGISQTVVFGPEVGWLGLLGNLLFAIWLVCILTGRTRAAAAPVMPT